VLFTTAAFAFLFLPIVLLGFYAIGRASHGAAAWWLFAASVFFYAYWMPEYAALLLGSIVANFWFGARIAAHAAPDNPRTSAAKRWFVAGVVFDLALLGYYKYANFFLDSLQAAVGAPLHIERILLPIGISFFTFTQIAFLADSYMKGVREVRFAHYGLFVTYFPHLVAGPVLHHAQMMPQFGRAETYRFQSVLFASGLAIFALGLVKKVVLADGISPYADAVFNGAAAGSAPTFAEGWIGALAYTFQLYYDFSGYSDMAIGLSLMVNVRLPFNFDSPYKSLSISEFWRRWHMTLSTFLRDYLYIPLGGNRHGPVRRYVNLATTMLLGGLWHGAAWTFVFWGGLHGAYLGVNHAFHAATARWAEALAKSIAFRVFAWSLTFLAVVVAWVYFRAPTFETAGRVLTAMTTPSAVGDGPASTPLLWNAGLTPTLGAALCALLGLVAVFAPNSNAIGAHLEAACRRAGPVRAAVAGAALVLVVFLVVVNEARESVSAFIYFNF
jgi:alginate O-acetyltransferase complex protein AlgI